jgi:hypothetical protein
VATSSAGTIRLVAVRKPPAHLASDAKTGVSDGWSLVLGGGAPTDISGHLDGRADLDLVSVDARNVTLTSTRSTVLKLGGPHPSLAKVDVKASGGLRADLAGEYPALDSFTMDLANGGGEIDLSGPWHHPTTLAFAASGGNLQLTLPRSANVKIVREGTGTVEVPAGFRPAESGSSNAAYAYAPGQVTSDSLTIRLAMSGGSAKLLFAGK